MYYEHQTCNTQPLSLALHPASPRSQREFCTPPGQVPQQSTSFYHPQDFRAGDFKRVFLGKQNGTCAYTEAETGGLRAVRGGIQVFFWDLVLQMVNHSLRQRSASGTPPAPAAYQNWTLSPLFFFLFLCNIRSGATGST